MTVEERVKYLKEYLYDNRLLDSYYANLIKDKEYLHNTQTIDERLHTLCNTDTPRSCFVRAFSWERSPEGFSFWFKVSQAFAERLIYTR